MTFPPTDDLVFFSRRACRCGAAMHPLAVQRGTRSWYCTRCGRSTRR